MSSSSRMPTEQRKRVEYFSNRSSSDSSPDEKRKPNGERLEKSLTNLQLNMRALSGKIEDMMTVFKQFKEEFKANHTILMEDVKELNDHAIDIKDEIRSNY